VTVQNNTPHRLAAGDRRLQLVEAALDVFSRKGYGGTTTKEIAAVAGVTEAIIFRHFPTKHDLYNAVLARDQESGVIAECIAEMTVCMERNDDEGLLRSLMTHVLEGHRLDPRGHRVMLFAALEGHEGALEFNRRLSLPIFALLCEYVARRQREGAVRPGDPGAVIAAAFCMAEQYGMQTQFYGFELGKSDAEMVEDFVAIMTHGIRNRTRARVKSTRAKSRGSKR
jgi:TetR/AcrR family transcriptional regulator